MLLKLLTRGPTILLFFAFLLFPVTWRFTQFPKIRPLEEYRKLVERPKPVDFFKPGEAGFLGYTKQVDAWFSDRFPTRPFWVRLYTQSLYMFGESDQVHIGPRNWLFYRTVLDQETPSLEKISPQARKEIIDRYVHLSDLLRQRGVTLIVMPVTLKHRYYPEFLPRDAQHARKFRFYDTFMDEFVKDGRVKVIDVRAALQAAKASGLKIYHKTDFHWTDPGGAVALRLVLNEIALLDGDRSIADRWRYDIIVEQGVSGGQARALPLFRAPTETTVGVHPVAPATVFDEKSNVDGIELSGVALPGQSRLLSPIVAFGDSFLDAGVRSGFFSSFQAFGRARLYSNELTEVWRHRPAGTRYLLLEFISSGLWGTDNSIRALIQALEADPAL